MNCGSCCLSLVQAALTFQVQCSAKEFIDIPAEKWTESPEYDDDESELAAVLLECEDPTGTNAVDDDSVEVKVMSLKEVREAAAGVLLFLEENKSNSQAAARGICAELSRMTVTARHVQPSVAELFRRASGSL